MKKVIGLNYLHRHTDLEIKNNIDSEHIIVDRKDWEEVVEYFHNNSEEAFKLGKNPTITNKRKIQSIETIR